MSKTETETKKEINEKIESDIEKDFTESEKIVEQTANETQLNAEHLLIIGAKTLNKVQTRKFEVIKEKIGKLFTDIQETEKKEETRKNASARKLIIKQKFAGLTLAELEKLIELQEGLKEE
jgi:hypothetical protein